MGVKNCMVIPSYWARESRVGWQPGDAVYDHPIPLDQEGTLLRALKSLGILKNPDVAVVVLAVPTSDEIADAVERKVQAIIDEARKTCGVPMAAFGVSHLRKVHQVLDDAGIATYKPLLQLRGYPNVRNLCVFVPHLLGAEVAILIDDDEVFEDPDFLKKATEFIGKPYQGTPVRGVAGYYLQANGEVLLNRPREPWMEAWDQLDRMNEAFDRFILQPPRLKETPFVFGGNMVIHRELFTRVPFDPQVPRGEDIDFLMNAKMFGFRFFLDNTLAIKHLPPPKSHPVWRRLREDVFRFLFEREKIRKQKKLDGMVTVTPEDFDTYPGAFLKDDLEKKVEKASRILADIYKSSGDEEGAREVLMTVTLMREAISENPDPFEALVSLQRQWHTMMRATDCGVFRELGNSLLRF